jgi:hypothetical protein
MDDWFSVLAAETALAAEDAAELDQRGFVVIPGVVPPQCVPELAEAYDSAVLAATPTERRDGRTSTRVSDFVNRGPAFDAVYVFPPLLAACCRIIGGPFKLSSLLARTLRPGASQQELHVDVRAESADWPLVGFILMIDSFRHDNGATRFVPGSHRWAASPEEALPDRCARHDGEVLALGTAGALLVFHGSTWHGHTANTSTAPRRSLQGAFIPSGGTAATRFAERMSPATYERLSLVARHVLAI